MNEVRCPSCEKMVHHGEPHTCYSRAEAELMSLRDWINGEHEKVKVAIAREKGPHIRGEANDYDFHLGQASFVRIVAAEIDRRLEAIRASR